MVKFILVNIFTVSFWKQNKNINCYLSASLHSERFLAKFSSQKFDLINWNYFLGLLSFTSRWSYSFVAYSISTCLTQYPVYCIWCSTWHLPSSLWPSFCWRCWGSPCWDWPLVAVAERTLQWRVWSWARVSTYWRRIRGSSCWGGREWGADEAQNNLKIKTYLLHDRENFCRN